MWDDRVTTKWQYYTFYPHGKKEPFAILGRLNEIFAGQNANAHHNNYTPHGGFGNGQPTTDAYQDRGIREGQAVQQLPHRANGANTPYIEVVWAGNGMPAGLSRIIYNQYDWSEVYFTDDHYTVYWRVYGAASTHTVFADE